MKVFRSAIASISLLAAAAAFAQPPAGGAGRGAGPMPGRGGFAQRAPGYLAREDVPDFRVFLAPPPTAGSPMDVAEMQIYRDTRKLEGSPRWELAAHDAEIGQRALFRDFSCAVGMELDAAKTPTLARAISRASADLGAIIGAANNHYSKPRPFTVEEGPTCVAVTESFAASGSYPSGHASSGWLYALLLAEADPENADAILARGRVYGESRVVCGVHYPSDVEGGRLAATAIVAALRAQPEFLADMAEARREIQEQRAAGPQPDAAQCSVEKDAATPPW